MCYAEVTCPFDCATLFILYSLSGWRLPEYELLRQLILLLHNQHHHAAVAVVGLMSYPMARSNMNFQLCSRESCLRAHSRDIVQEREREREREICLQAVMVTFVDMFFFIFQ